MKLFSRIKKRFSEANRDVINQCCNNKWYLFGIWGTIILFLVASYPYIREVLALKGDRNIIFCTIGLGSLIVFAISQYLDSLIWGIHISEKEFKDFDTQKNHWSYLTYVQRLIFTFGVLFCVLSLVGLLFSKPDSDLYSSFGNTVTIMGLGITFLLWMDSTAKEAKQKHEKFKKNLEDEINKQKSEEDFTIKVKEYNKKLQEKMEEIDNHIFDSYKQVNNQLKLLNKEIQVIKCKIETKQKE